MKALSLWQPWAHAVAHLGKRIENRDRWHEGTPQLAEARRLVGKTFLIHAAKGVGTRLEFRAACEAIVSIVGPRAIFGLVDVNAQGSSTWPPSASLPRMALVARATLADVVRTSSGGHRCSPGSISCGLCGDTGDMRPPHGVCPKADPWALPGVGLVLADVVPLATPVPYPGRQGWFDVPDGTVAP